MAYPFVAIPGTGVTLAVPKFVCYNPVTDPFNDNRPDPTNRRRGRSVMISRRAAMGLMTTGLSALALSTRSAFALNYPTRPVRFVVGFAAGGATDILARLVA